MEWNEKEKITNSPKKTSGKWTNGYINKIVGSGENAKHSIVTIVIICSFISISVITILIVINYWCFRDCENKVPDIVNDLKGVWEIIIPIITLSLGYEFGKYDNR